MLHELALNGCGRLSPKTYQDLTAEVYELIYLAVLILHLRFYMTYISFYIYIYIYKTTGQGKYESAWNLYSSKTLELSQRGKR